MTTDFHVVSNNSGHGSVRYAIIEKLLSGKVGHADDALEVGPLGDGLVRAMFWREIEAAAYPDFVANRPLHDKFSPWLKMRREILRMQPARILIWASGSGADYVLLRMACRKLADTGIPMYHIAVPPKEGDHAVTVHSSQELAPMAAHARRLTIKECNALALEFDSIAARPELLRECDEHGQLRFGHLGDHDDLLMAELSAEWRLAPRVIGAAMGNSDPRNGASDGLVAARLRHLIDSGVAEEEYRAEPRTWRNWYVRLKTPG